MRKVVGIDLGTTYTVVSSYDEHSKYPKALKNSQGKEITPSVLFFDNQDFIIGQEAKNEFSGGTSDSVAFYKRYMGHDNYQFNYNNKSYSATELSGIFLRELIKEINEEENINITDAVITVPAYFDEEARLETIKAGEMAGLNVLAIINEPTAAMIAHGLNNSNISKNVMVFDLGGGTFDVTIANITGSKIDVISTDGDYALGGKDFDDAIVDFLISKFSDEFGYDPTDDDIEMRTVLLHDAEAIKIRLSNLESTNIKIRSNSGDIGDYKITREDFEFASQVIINKTMEIINSSLEAAKLDWNNLDEVVLIGGSTRMPLVRKFIEDKIGKPPLYNADVDMVVSFGAAIRADLEIKRETLGSKANTLVLKPRETKAISLAPSDISDVTGHALGILTFDKDESNKIINSVILEENSKINTEMKKTYLTNSDKLEIYLLQGKTENPRLTTLIGKYTVEDVKKDMKVEIYLKYNSNGVVDVRATHQGKDLVITKHQVNEDIDEVMKKIIEESENGRQKSNSNIIIAVDTSGSMYGKPIEVAKEAVYGLLNQLPNNQVPITLLEFDDLINVLIKEEKNISLVRNSVNDIKTPSRANYSRPITYILEKLNVNKNTIVVLLTDGVWIYPKKEIKSSEKLKIEEVLIHAVGVGSADERFLKEIGSFGLSKHVNLNKLITTFEAIGSSIATELK